MSRMKNAQKSMMFGLTNVKRCLFAALLSVAAFPGLLLLAVIEPEFTAAYLIPTAFFSIGSGAFAPTQRW